jgi:hypothetical protein
MTASENKSALGRDGEAHPSTIVVDSQSVKSTERGVRGYDGGKRVKGRKRQIAVDVKLRTSLVLPRVWCYRRQGGCKTRKRSKSNLARPYIMRLMTFKRLTCPSTWPLLHSRVSAALTAA